MALTRAGDGRITFELNDAEVEAYVKAGIDRRLDNLFQVHHRMGTRELVREAVSSYLKDHTEELRSHMVEAMGTWLSAREGWVASMLARRRGEKPETKDL
jgi:hypothetical protein